MRQKPKWIRFVTLWILWVYIGTALLSPWIAWSYPILYKINGQWKWSYSTPSVHNFDDTEICILPWVPFGPQKTDLKDAHLPPLSYSHSLPDKKHWLGTDKLGRDILAGMIHGSSISLKIGFLSVLLSMLLGVPMGIFASYYGDKGVKLNVLQWIFLFISGFLYTFYIRIEWISLSVSELLFYTFCALSIWLAGHHFLKCVRHQKKIPIPVDTLVIKIAELRKSFPGLFILLALTTLFETRSEYHIVIIIVLLSWMEFARYARAESLSVIHSPFIESAQLMGFKDMYIIWKHILPNIFPVLIVLGSYGVSNAILLESSLSFLGIGLPTEVVTWGKMLADGRNIQYPWMVIFPGLAIFVLIWVLHQWADMYKP